MAAAYKLNNFINDCGYGSEKASVLRGAMETARTDFNLKTQGDVLRFISNEGLESPSFINSKKWENNPKPETVVMVDAYGFYSGFLYGYVAFFYQDITKKWVIKSFKKNREPDTRNLAFKRSLHKLLGQG